MELVGTVDLESERCSYRKVQCDDIINGELIKEKTWKHFRKVYQDNGYEWAIVDKDLNIIVGVIGLAIVSEYHEVVELKFRTYENFRLKGYMSEAVKTIIQFAFDTLIANRVQGICEVNNFGSAKVMLNCSMVQEGVLRSYAKVNENEYSDCYIYSIIQND